MYVLNDGNDDLAPTKALGAKLIYAALTILKNNDGEMPGREVVAQIEKTVPLDEWATARYEKTGNIRWKSILHFYSIDCVKAGFLVKKKGTWYITPEGEEALELGEVELINAAQKEYRKWKRSTKMEPVPPEPEVEEETSNGVVDLDEIEQLAQESLKSKISNTNPYEFQDLVASLLRAMGYYTPFVAPRGKDGGVDIVAYRDPLGIDSPRIKVQVKHRENNPASVHEIRQLMGLLQLSGEVGIFISTGGFTTDAKNTARNSHVHVELIDLSRFLSLWEEFYDKLPDEEKSQLPLYSINFLAPST